MEGHDRGRGVWACHDVYERIHKAMADSEALDTIQGAMSGLEWNSNTLDRIAEIIEETGRELKDVD